MLSVIELAIPAVKLISPHLFHDERGFFLESYNKKELDKLLGEEITFVQDNHSHSKRDVLRGLHYQIQRAQGKLVRVVSGTIYDIAVDMCRSSPTFGKWVGVELSASMPQMLWIPPQFAHGFLVISESADVLYKATDYYSPKDERVLCWSDPDVAISWPLQQLPLLSPRDSQGCLLAAAETFP